MNKLVELFCDVDDFCRVFIPEWEKQLISDGTRKRNRACRMTMSEIITIILLFICQTFEISKIIIKDISLNFICGGVIKNENRVNK